MNQLEIIDMLNKLNMKYTVIEHPPADTIDEIESFRMPNADTPLGILNDKERKVKVFIDEELIKFHTIGIHPNENTATLWLSPHDLQNIIENHGGTVNFLKI